MSNNFIEHNIDFDSLIIFVIIMPTSKNYISINLEN